MLFNYEGRIWNRQGTSIENVKTTHEYGIGIKILSLDIYIYILFLGGMYLTQGTGMVDLSICYLNHFAQSKINSRDYAHLYLHHNNLYCVRLPTHPTNADP